MTDLKSLVFYLSLHVLFQVQSATAYQYNRAYNYDVRISPLPLTGTAPSHTATPAVHSSENKWQYHGEYSWYLPQETRTPHPTGSLGETQYGNPSFHPSPKGYVLDPYPSHAPIRPSYSAVDVSGCSRISNSTSKAVILPSTGTGSSAVYKSSSAPSSRVSASIPLGDLKGTTIETITLVPTPVSPTPRWVTKRSVPAPSRPAQKSSTSKTTSKKTSSTKTSSTKTSSKKSAAQPTSASTCPSGKFYTVVSGDTCTKIAAQQKVPVGKLISQNKLPSACNTLQIGQKLCVPQCKSYIVQPGDFCFKITEKFDVELSDFYAANP